MKTCSCSCTSTQTYNWLRFTFLSLSFHLLSVCFQAHDHHCLAFCTLQYVFFTSASDRIKAVVTGSGIAYQHNWSTFSPSCPFFTLFPPLPPFSFLPPPQFPVLHSPTLSLVSPPNPSSSPGHPLTHPMESSKSTKYE